MNRTFQSAMSAGDVSYVMQLVKLPTVGELEVIRGELLQLAELNVEPLPRDLNEDGRFEALIAVERIMSEIAQRTPTPMQQWRLGVRLLLSEFVTVCKVMD